MGFALAPLVIFGLAAAWQFYDNSSRAQNGQIVDTALLAWNALLIMLLIAALRGVPRRIVWTCAAVGGIALAGAAGWGAYELSRGWHDGYARHYDTMFRDRIFQRLEQVETPGTRVCVFGDRYYPFFGSRRQFAPCRPPYLASREQALEYVRRQRASLVSAIRDARPRAERFDGWGGWLSDYPEVFVPVQTASQSTARFDLFKVDHAMLERVLADRTAVASGPDAEPAGPGQTHEAAAGKAQP